MLKYLFLLGIMAEWVFFLFLSLFNLKYQGASESNLYVIYWITILVLSLISLFIYLLNYFKVGKMPKNIFVNFLPIFIVIMLYLISFLKFGYNYTGNGYYAKIFVSMCIPTFLIGYICSINKKENQLVKIVVQFVIFGTGILVISLYRLVSESIVTDSLDSVGGVGRLGIGYLATHFFIVTFYIFVFNNKISKISLPLLLRSRFKYTTIFIMLSIQISTVIFAGSRGPLLNLLLVCSMMIVLKLFQSSIVSFSKKLLSIIVIIICLLQFYNTFGQNYFALSTERTLTLFQLEKDNWAGGSGRESLYPLAYKMFSEKPVFGFGPMGFLSESGAGMYPHNIFLESMVDYGAIGLVVIVLFFIYLIKKYINRIDRNISLLLILFLFFSSLIELQVSGTFIAHARLWFFIGLGMGINNARI
jgi:O-antigen ligase